MSVMNEMGSNVSFVKNWYDSLSEKEQDNTAIYMIIGDMESKHNVDCIAGGSIEKLVIAVAQSMVADKDFYTVAKAAVSLVEKYNEGVVEELVASVGKADDKFVS